MKKNLLLLTVLLCILTIMGCKNNDDEQLGPRTKPITTKLLCGCTWYSSPDHFLSFFENGTFEEYYDSGRLANTIAWRCLYKGTWHLENKDDLYWVEATYTKVYLNAYEEELKDYCTWSKEDMIISNDYNVLYIGNTRYERIDYVAPNMTQY